MFVSSIATGISEQALDYDIHAFQSVLSCRPLWERSRLQQQEWPRPIMFNRAGASKAAPNTLCQVWRTEADAESEYQA